MEAQEQRRELEEEAAEGGSREFDLQRRQPTNGSTTTVTINAGKTGFSSSSPSESEQSGADFSQQLVEGGKFSYESFELTSGEVNFNDFKDTSSTPATVMGTVVVDIATERFGIQNIDEIFKSTEPPPSKKNSSIQELIADETSINIGAIEQEERVRTDTREEIVEQKEIRELYLETVYKKPAASDFYCPNCQACIDKVLISSRLADDEWWCPFCCVFLKPLVECFLRKPVPGPVPGPPSLEFPERPDADNEKPTDTGTIKLEIVKSLVYGGLNESIASLSVVTSAASAAASTLNIVVLALANLIGGLFIIGHNLRDLKTEQSRVALNDTEEQADRYQQLLGQKKNFIIHASVAVISFLVCGLVPPVVYGFSFYKSDNSYLKLAVVAATSLICITILAIAKTYTQRPTRWYMYLRTVLYYISLGVGASGISYLAGYLFKLLIDKLGWFESSAALTLFLPGMSSMSSAQVSSN